MHFSETDTNRQQGVRWTHGFCFLKCMCYRLDESRLLTI